MLNEAPHLQPPDRHVADRLRILRTIAAALIAGVVIFAAIAAAQASPSGAAGANVNLLRMAWAAVAVGGLPVLLLMRQSLVKQAARTMPASSEDASDGLDVSRAEHLAGRFVALTIVTLAVLEAPALFGAVILLLGGEMVDLVLVALPLVTMLWHFPTDSRYRRFERAVDERRAVR